MLMVLLLTLLLVCLLFLPAIFGLRLSSERAQQRMDLLFITDMSPYSIIFGKTVAGIVLTLLLFSASMPFVTLTYLLRGIDLPSIFIMMMLNFAVVVLTIQGALLLASMPGGIISMGIRFLFGLGGAAIVMSMMAPLSYTMLNSGIGSLMGTWDFWATFLTAAVFLTLAMGFLFVLSAVIISPASANRAPVPRIYLLFIWVCSTLCTFLWYMKTRSSEIFQLWAVLIIILFSTVFVISLAERYDYGPRIKRRIPCNRLLRIPLFLLYSGAGGGVLFSILMLLLTLGVFAVTWHLGIRIRFGDMDSYNLPLRFFSQALYLFCYGFTALVVRRLLLPKEASNQITLMILFILLAFGSLAPFLFAWFFIYHNVDKIPEYWFLGNPLIVFLETDALEYTLYFTGIWSLAALALNVPWFIAQMRDFKPLPAAVTPPPPPIQENG